MSNDTMSPVEAFQAASDLAIQINNLKEDLSAARNAKVDKMDPAWLALEEEIQDLKARQRALSGTGNVPVLQAQLDSRAAEHRAMMQIAMGAVAVKVRKSGGNRRTKGFQMEVAAAFSDYLTTAENPNPDANRHQFVARWNEDHGEGESITVAALIKWTK